MHDTIATHLFMAFEGPAYMVGIAICTTVNAYKSFEDNDIILNIRMLKGMSSLTRNQRLECTLFLQMIKDRKRDTKSTHKKNNNK